MKYLNKKKIPPNWVIVKMQYEDYTNGMKFSLQRHPSRYKFSFRYMSDGIYWFFEDSEDALFFKLNNSKYIASKK
jgi:hypothetical protein